MTETDRVMILGSGPDVLRARAWPRAGLGRIVAINNAWRVRPDWSYLTHPQDFAAERMPRDLRPGQTLVGHTEYVPAVNAFGGFVYCGGTMAFTAAYWALYALRPRLMAFLGCDMIYPATGPTHFYGNGSPDPLRADPTLQSLEAKSARFAITAARAGCAVVNLSDCRASRLVFGRTDHAGLLRWSEEDGRSSRDVLLGPSARARATEAHAAEEALGYRVPSGRYWRHFDAFDAKALARIDSLWLHAAGAYSAAA